MHFVVHFHMKGVCHSLAACLKSSASNRVILVPAVTLLAPLVCFQLLGIDRLQEMKGDEHKEHKQKDSTRNRQQHVAPDEQRVHYL